MHNVVTLFQALSVLMVAQNTVELLIGLKALPKGAKVNTM